MQLDEIIKKHGGKPEDLIQIMLDYQNSKDMKYLSEDDLKQLSEKLGVSESRVSSVASFYPLLSIRPRGRHIVQVCKDLPCHINGAANIVASLQDILGIKTGETTDDGAFTLENTSCLGCCDRAPAVRIDGELHTGLDAAKLAGIIKGYRDMDSDSGKEIDKDINYDRSRDRDKGRRRFADHHKKVRKHKPRVHR